MIRTAPFILLAASTSLVAGCVSTGSGGGGGTPSPAVFATSAGTAIQALDNGETLMAYDSQMSSSLEHDYDESETRAIAPVQFSITANGQGAYDVVIDGQSYSFTAAELNDFGMKNLGGTYNVNSWSGDFEDVVDLANGSHHQVWSYWWDPAGQAISGFAVVGTETMPAALTGKAEATYVGSAGASLSDTGAFNTTTDIFGILTMTADFDNNEISGSVTDLEVLGTGDINGTVTLNSGTISGTGFGGTVSAATDLGNLGGSYNGKFFGANGQELGGVLALTGDDVVGTGFISATQQP